MQLFGDFAQGLRIFQQFQKLQVTQPQSADPVWEVTVLLIDHENLSINNKW
jgi:hypothetical protein